MSKGKQIKPLPSPDLNQTLSLELIGQSIKARRTQQKLDIKTTAMLCDVSAVTLGKIEKNLHTHTIDLSILTAMNKISY